MDDQEPELFVSFTNAAESSFGISMVPPYDERRRADKLNIRAEPKVVKE